MGTKKPRTHAIQCLAYQILILESARTCYRYLSICYLTIRCIPKVADLVCSNNPNQLASLCYICNSNALGQWQGHPEAKNDSSKSCWSAVYNMRIQAQQWLEWGNLLVARKHSIRVQHIWFCRRKFDTKKAAGSRQQAAGTKLYKIFLRDPEEPTSSWNKVCTLYNDVFATSWNGLGSKSTPRRSILAFIYKRMIETCIY